MKEKKVFTVTDLGPGDGGKGGVVHALCVRKQPHTVIKVGGAQGSHGVRTASGESFNFRQFGCGTLTGVKTHITDRMIVEPYGLLQEGERLQYECGIQNIFDMITVDGNAVCITPYHRIASRLRELARKDNPKGTIGTGAGEALNDSEMNPDTKIYVRDIGKPVLRQKLNAVKEQKIKDLSEIIASVGGFLPDDIAYAQEQIKLLNDLEFTERIAAMYEIVAAQVKIVDSEYLTKEILSRDGVVVVESSHGVLTDRYYGFHPHTTKLRTIPQITLQMLEACGYDGDIVRLGVTRAYQIRHGAGPMVTESPSMVDTLLPGSSKEENRWQGKVRVGPLDLVALRYAIDVCGGAQVFDGLAVTWFDQIKMIGKWNICESYTNTDERFFSSSECMRVYSGNREEQFCYQESLGKQLNACRPDSVLSIDISEITSREELSKTCNQVLQDKLGVPVRMISFGSTENDKVYL